MGGFLTRPESHPTPPTPDSSSEIGTLSTEPTYEMGTFSTVATSITGLRDTFSLELERMGMGNLTPDWYAAGGTVIVQFHEPHAPPTETEDEAEGEIDYQSDGDGPFGGDHEEEADQPGDRP